MPPECSNCCDLLDYAGVWLCHACADATLAHIEPAWAIELADGTLHENPIGHTKTWRDRAAAKFGIGWSSITQTTARVVEVEVSVRKVGE